MAEKLSFGKNLFGEEEIAPELEAGADRFARDAAAGKTEEPAGIVSVLAPMPQTEPYSYAVPQSLLPADYADAQNAPCLPAGIFVRAPLGGRKVAGIVVSDMPQPVALSKLRSIDKIFDCPPLTAEFLQFIRFAADYTMTPIGMVARMVLCVPAALEPPAGLKALQWTGKQPDKITKARARIMELVSRCPIWTRSGLAHAAGVSSGVIDGLKAQNIFTETELPPEPAVPPPQADFAHPVLAEGQKQAAKSLCQAVEARSFSVSLLEGVTGSGKTEVYFEAVASALRQGRQILILLPEIALTQQMLARFEARFGAPPAAWHSDITPQKREKIWRQTAEGQIRIVAGARSALFLPFEDLGLIIVDEEHDPSYKQEERVFYNARDMAVARGRFADIPVILSSATPAVESLVNVLQGRYRPVHLPSRFGEGVLPDIHLVDMRKTPPPKGRFLAEPLTQAIEETLAKGEQSLLFLNRRGYAPLTLCRACGHRFSCPDCSAWLVEHKGQYGQPKQLVCHHCGFHRPVPEACPECGALDHLVPVGPGVERIAEEAVKLFPEARILVLSADTAQSVKQMRAELDSVVRGEVDIVIGTQLVAKGHHFPKMTCAGVVDADVGLNNGDLRAGERSFQLLSQVTGRAGREAAQSRAFIQTYQPDHPAIQALARGDGQAFIHREIEERAAYHLPPFGQLAAIIVSAEEREDAENYARALRRLAPEAAGLSILGPAEAPLARLRGRWRFRLLIQAQTRRLHIQAYIRALIEAAPKPKSGVRAQIDIDPQSFL